MGDIDLLPVQADPAAGCDDDRSVVEWVFEFGKSIVGPLGRSVNLRGHPHFKGLMGPFFIEFQDELIEDSLLLKAVCLGGPGGFLLEREVHSFVPTILLGLARLDTLNGDTQP